jgi:hypothetical protein
VEIYNAYGCYVTKYKVSTKKRDWMFEEVTFAFDHVVATASVAVVPFLTQAPFVYANAAQPDLGAASVDTEEESIEITNTYADNELIGSYYGHVPILMNRDVKCEFTGKSDINAKVATAYTAAIVPFTVVMGNVVNAAGTAKDITITNMMLDPEASDFKTLPERDLVKYKFVLTQGGLSVITVEA